MALFAIALPILPGKTDAWRRFADELKGPQRAAFEESRRRLGVRERTWLQTTPMGDLVVVTLEGDKPAEAFAAFAASDDAFTTWFKEQAWTSTAWISASRPLDPCPSWSSTAPPADPGRRPPTSRSGARRSSVRS